MDTSRAGGPEMEGTGPPSLESGGSEHLASQLAALGLSSASERELFIQQGGVRGWQNRFSALEAKCEFLEQQQAASEHVALERLKRSRLVEKDQRLRVVKNETVKRELGTLIDLDYDRADLLQAFRDLVPDLDSVLRGNAPVPRQLFADVDLAWLLVRRTPWLKGCYWRGWR